MPPVFQSTRPGGRDPACTRVPCTTAMQVSIHAPGGARPATGLLVAVLGEVSIHAPGGARPGIRPPASHRVEEVSIHAPGGARPTPSPDCGPRFSRFNPRARGGATPSCVTPAGATSNLRRPANRRTPRLVAPPQTPSQYIFTCQRTSSRHREPPEDAMRASRSRAG